jgi:hypothetical protein
MTKNCIAMITLFLICLYGCETRAEITPIKMELSATVLRESGFAQQIFRVGALSVASWKKARPDIPAEFWEEQVKDIGMEYGRRLLDAHITAYANQFTEKELQELIAFWRTPTGRKLHDFGQRVFPMLEQETTIAAEGFSSAMQKRIKKSGF